MDLKIEKNPEYNLEPVYYCTKCLSLKIRGIGDSDDFDYCDECGCTTIDSTDIKNWEELYIKRYGHKFLEA